MARPEHNLQCAAWVFAQHVLPDDADYASVETKIGADAKLMATHRKAAGIRAGEPDARVIWRGRVTFIEFKSATGYTSAVQKLRHKDLERAGAQVFVVRSIATLEAVFLGLGIPLRFHALPAAARDQMLGARQTKTARTKRRAVR